MYWILASERSDEYELTIDHLPPIADHLDLYFDDGSPAKKSVPLIEISYVRHPQERKTDNIIVPTRLGWLFNQKIEAIFNSLSIDNIRYYPARLIEHNTGHIDDDYVITHIVGRIACVNHDESDLEYDEAGNIRFINGLSLDNERCHGHIFRLEEFPPITVISDHLKTALEQNKVTGIRIYHPQDFDL